MAIWVVGGRLSVLIPISTSPFNINSCSAIKRGKVVGLLRPIFSYTIVTKMINSIMARVKVASLLRPISTSTIITTMINSKIERG